MSSIHDPEMTNDQAKINCGENVSGTLVAVLVHGTDSEKAIARALCIIAENIDRTMRRQHRICQCTGDD